jgi:hypothetical protein
MSSAKITQTMFYDEYGNNRVALLEEGQTIEIDKVLEFDEYHFENVYLCRVVNPSDKSKNYDVRDGMLVKVYEENLEMD